MLARPFWRGSADRDGKTGGWKSAFAALLVSMAVVDTAGASSSSSEVRSITTICAIADLVNQRKD